MATPFHPDAIGYNAGNGMNAMSPSDSASTPIAAEPAVFLSGDVARIAGVSPRQLQWLDERQVVSPRKEGRRRKYAPQQVLEVLTVSALRKKGLSLQKLRRVLRLLRHEWPSLSGAINGGASRMYLLTNGDAIHLDTQPQRILEHLAGAKNPMFVVCLSDLAGAIPAEKPRRRRNRQLPLF